MFQIDSGFDVGSASADWQNHRSEFKKESWKRSHFLYKLYTMSSKLEASYESELPYPPLHKDAKFVVLTDWVGSVLQNVRIQAELEGRDDYR